MPPNDPPIDTEELMARVRATLGSADEAREDAGPSPPIVLSPHFHQEQLLLDQAQRVANVGTAVPPFGGLAAILRPIARLTTRGLYFLLQVISVDQRVFNNLLLNVVRMTSAGLAQGEAALNERLRRWAAAGAARESRVQALETSLAELRAALAELGAAFAERQRLGEALEQRVAALEERLGALEYNQAGADRARAAADEALGGRVATLEAAGERAEQERYERREVEERTAHRLARGDAVLTDLGRRIAAAQTSIAAQERRLANLGQAANRALAAPRADDNEPAETIADEAAHAFDALYADFETYFRGSADDIKERLQVYLPDVQAVVGGAGGQVLDLGCGRGEWLSLLAEEGISARGVDFNRVQVEHCRSQGLDVVEAEVHAHLASLPDESVAVVTAFHVAEHLGYAALLELLDHAVRILRPGGLLILETPNPGNVLVGGCEFYLDPTHQRPLPSPLAQFLLQARGLRDVQIRPLHPAPEYERLDASGEVAERLNRYLYGPRDYAALGFKA